MHEPTMILSTLGVWRARPLANRRATVYRSFGWLSAGETLRAAPAGRCARLCSLREKSRVVSRYDALVTACMLLCSDAGGRAFCRACCWAPVLQLRENDAQSEGPREFSAIGFWWASLTPPGYAFSGVITFGEIFPERLVRQYCATWIIFHSFLLSKKFMCAEKCNLKVADMEKMPFKRDSWLSRGSFV